MWLLLPLLATPLLAMLLLHPHAAEDHAATAAVPQAEQTLFAADARVAAAGSDAPAPLAAELSPPPPPPPLPPPPADTGACHGTFEVMPGVDLPQEDLDTAPWPATSVSQCCELCEQQRATRGCVALTFTPAGECWLKRRA